MILHAMLLLVYGDTDDNTKPFLVPCSPSLGEAPEKHRRPVAKLAPYKYDAIDNVWDDHSSHGKGSSKRLPC